MIPMKDIFERLREKLDEIATGYPATRSGVEIRLLKQMFTQREAELFLVLSPVPEKPEHVAGRLGQDLEIIALQLEEMAGKGLLFRIRRGDFLAYSIMPFVIGIMEFQLKRVTPEFSRDLTTYFINGLGKTFQGHKTPVMRTIPINRDVVAKWPVAPYDDVMQIFSAQKTIAVAHCICRMVGVELGNSCGKPLEACFIFGAHADYYVENSMARYIDAQEAQLIVDRSLEKTGLVLQPTNGKKIVGLCMCCGCHCGMLLSLKFQPKPAAAAGSNYFAQVNTETCIGCNVCHERCQIAAVKVIAEKAVINLDRCIGCGACIATCPTEALKLMKKSEEHLYLPPEDLLQAYIEIGKERGKI